MSRAVVAEGPAAVPEGPEGPAGTQPYRLRMPHMHGGELRAPGDVVHLYPDQVALVQAAEAAAGLPAEVTHG